MRRREFDGAVVAWPLSAHAKRPTERMRGRVLVAGLIILLCLAGLGFIDPGAIAHCWAERKPHPSASVHIAWYGGGFDISAKDHTQDNLVQLAQNTAAGKGTLILRDIASKSVGDLVNIAASAPGGVIFVDP